MTQPTAQGTGWSWSRGASTLLRIAKVQLTVAVYVTIELLHRRIFAWWMLLAIWGLGAFLVGTGLRWRHLNRISQQAHRDERAAELVQQVLRGETRQFALYIRPFDWTGVLPIRNPGHRPSDDPFRELPVIDLEEFFARGLAPSLPLIALGWPGEAIGAGRYETAVATWQSDIQALAERATLIVALPLYSDSVVWEVKLLRDRGWLEKTLFVMPPQLGPFPITVALRLNRGRVALESLGMSLPEIEKGGQLFVMVPSGEYVARSWPFPSWVDELPLALDRLFLRRVGAP